MNLTGLHFLTTYQCTLECDHCFSWSSPWQTGVMTAKGFDHILDEALQLGSIKSVYFEGGEAGLFYTTLLHGVRAAVDRGFSVGLVTNAFWAISEKDAVDWLKPFVSLLDHISITDDLYYGQIKLAYRISNAQIAAVQLGIPIEAITVMQRRAVKAISSQGKMPGGQSSVMFRGRAARTLANQVAKREVAELTCCPVFDDLVNPSRLHVDPFGFLHICQGLTIGNVFHNTMSEIVAAYDHKSHPITGPLVEGGPAELVDHFELPISGVFADACHLCDTTRRGLRSRFPRELAPDQMYGLVN